MTTLKGQIGDVIRMMRDYMAKGKEIVFDCDQVLYDKGEWNTELLDAIKEEGIEIKIASHGTTIEKAEFKYEEVEFDSRVIVDEDGLPVFDEKMRPISAKTLDDKYVLVDDRADEWAVHTGKTNYIQYEWTA